jgi:hypothetical protein
MASLEYEDQDDISSGHHAPAELDRRNQSQALVNGSKLSRGRCPYHSFVRTSVDHNSPVPPETRLNFTSLLEGDSHKNVSHELMFNKDAFTKQSLLYQSHHKKFLFTRPKIGDRADRVYSYYENEADWSQDRYLSKS